MKTLSVPVKNTTVITAISDLGFLCTSLVPLNWTQKKIFSFLLSQFLFTSDKLVISKISLLFSMACHCKKCLDKAG